MIQIDLFKSRMLIFYAFTACFILSGCKQSETSSGISYFEAVEGVSQVQGNGITVCGNPGNVKSGDLILQPFKNPEVIESKNGLIDTKLDIGYTTHEIYNGHLKKNVKVRLRSYNGSLVGPTFKLNQGDILRVRLNNQLPEIKGDAMTADMGAGHNAMKDPCNQRHPASFNTTNLHTHGLHVSPNDSSDNVLKEIQPSEQFQNHIVLPEDHPAGTFWYHAHVHGGTAIQVSSGMGGALLVKGGLDQVPEISQAKERIFMMQQVPYDPIDTVGNEVIYGVENFDKAFGPGAWGKGFKEKGWRTMINGQTVPVITIESGAVERWRFVHAGVRETLNLQLQGHKFHEIAKDGIALGRMISQGNVVMQPGYRSDVLIKARNVKKTTCYYLIDGKSLESVSLQGLEEVDKVLAVVKVTPPVKAAMSLPSSESLAQYAPFKTITKEEVADQPVQQVKFEIKLGGEKPCFWINGKTFDGEQPRELKLNTANEWRLSSTITGHPFHIHVNHFEVFKVERTSGVHTIYDPPIWKDTYFVTPGETVYLRSRYKDFTGDFVLHCHILDHEDQGMMELVRILD